MCLVHCFEEMVRDLCGISYEDWCAADDTNYMTSISKEIRNPG